MSQSPTIGVVVVTYRAVQLLPACLPPLLQSSLKPRILVINSSSEDGTVELAEQMGAETLVIPRNQFNHGTTREVARKHLGTDIVVMITPDAVCASSETIGNLVKPLLDGRAAVAYARQLPHNGADFFEAFPRTFNYPPQSETRSIEDLPRLGPQVFFCSDSCAAWSNHALDEIGGFEWTLTAEDTLAAAKLLYRGYRVAYAADALVHHSHRYSIAQEFRRYFDTGLFRREHRDLLFNHGGDGARGMGFFRAMMATLLRENPYLMPYAAIQTLAKYLGYEVGYRSVGAPNWLKARLSSQDYYWISERHESAT